MAGKLPSSDGELSNFPDEEKISYIRTTPVKTRMFKLSSSPILDESPESLVRYFSDATQQSPQSPSNRGVSAGLSSVSGGSKTPRSSPRSPKRSPKRSRAAMMLSLLSPTKPKRRRLLPQTVTRRQGFASPVTSPVRSASDASPRKIPPPSVPSTVSLTPSPFRSSPEFRSRARSSPAKPPRVPMRELTNCLPKNSRASFQLPKSKQQGKMQLTLDCRPKTTCKQCGMSFIETYKQDVELHNSFHTKMFYGRTWNSSWGAKKVSAFQLPGGSEAFICQIDAKKLGERRAALELAELVNSELSAPQDTQRWLKNDSEGKAYVCVVPADFETELGVFGDAETGGNSGKPRGKLSQTNILSFTAKLSHSASISRGIEPKVGRPRSKQKFRAVGMVIVERIHSGYWMKADEGSLVSGDVDYSSLAARNTLISQLEAEADLETQQPAKHSDLIMGISRIFVSRNFRRQGIGKRLLEAAQKNFVYGFTIPKYQIAWSQPSETGSRLAASWSGVALLDPNEGVSSLVFPVYLEAKQEREERVKTAKAVNKEKNVKQELE